MPQMAFKYTEGGVLCDKVITREAGCFCFLGRNSDYLSFWRSFFSPGERELVSGTWLNFKCRSTSRLKRKPKYNPEYCMFEYLVRTFGFMRTMITTPEDLYKGDKPEFNFKGYTLNEVMHALFYLRSTAHVYDYFRMLRKNKVPPNVAYMVCTWKYDLQVLRNPYTPSDIRSLSAYWSGNDDCIRNNSRSSVHRFMSIVLGDVTPEFEGGTLKENAEKRERYPENIRSLWNCKVKDKSEGLQKFYSESILSALARKRESTKVKTSRLGSTSFNLMDDKEFEKFLLLFAQEVQKRLSEVSDPSLYKKFICEE